MPLTPKDMQRHSHSEVVNMGEALYRQLITPLVTVPPLLDCPCGSTSRQTVGSHFVNALGRLHTF